MFGMGQYNNMILGCKITLDQHHFDNSMHNELCQGFYGGWRRQHLNKILEVTEGDFFLLTDTQSLCSPQTIGLGTSSLEQCFSTLGWCLVVHTGLLDISCPAARPEMDITDRGRRHGLVGRGPMHAF